MTCLRGNHGSGLAAAVPPTALEPDSAVRRWGARGGVGRPESSSRAPWYLLHPGRRVGSGIRPASGSISYASRRESRFTPSSIVISRSAVSREE